METAAEAAAGTVTAAAGGCPRVVAPAPVEQLSLTNDFVFYSTCVVLTRGAIERGLLSAAPALDLANLTLNLNVRRARGRWAVTGASAAA